MDNERLVFKFYKSYFDTAKLLDDKNRLAFYDALLEKQFNFIEPTLSGLAELVYVSQKHNIDSQVNGWLEKIKSMGIEPPALPPIAPPALQLEKKYKEKKKKEKKVEYNSDVIFVFDSVKILFEEKYMNESSKASIDKLLKSYQKEDIIKAIQWAKNDSFWNSNFLSLSKLDKKNKEDVKYIDVFLSKMKFKNTNNTTNNANNRRDLSEIDHSTATKLADM
jgi:hypothetical protein